MAQQAIQGGCLLPCCFCQCMAFIPACRAGPLDISSGWVLHCGIMCLLWHCSGLSAVPHEERVQTR